MEQNRRKNITGAPPSPRLQRIQSRAVSSNSKQQTSRESPNSSSDSGQKPGDRSKSTARSRNIKDEENRIPAIPFQTKIVRAVLGSEKRLLENKELSIGFSQRLNLAGDLASKDAFETGKMRKARSVTGSPSAWALSPGRSPSTVMESENSGKQKSGFLKIFRPAKKDLKREEHVHQFRLFHNRLIQWRFVNAKGEATMKVRKQSAEMKSVSAWLRMSRLHSSVVGKRIQIQKLENEIKLYRILDSQLSYLQEWEKIEKRNLEALIRSSRVLQATTIKVPLVRGAKGNLISVYGALCEATDIMDGIETSIQMFLLEPIEKMSSMLIELRKTLSQEKEHMEELMQLVAAIASLEVQESSLRAHLLQVFKEKAGHKPLKHQTSHSSSVKLNIFDGNFSKYRL